MTTTSSPESVRTERRDLPTWLTVVVVVLCLALARLLPDLERRFRYAAVAMVVVGLLPVVVLATDASSLALGAVAFLAVVTQLYVVYLLFKAASAAPEHAERAAP